MPTALITGVTGHDGACLAQLLLARDYRVIGLLRRSSSSDVIGERLGRVAETPMEDKIGELVDADIARHRARLGSDPAPGPVR